MKKGFTLMELVLVIGIIAILAAVIAPRFMSQMPKAEISSVKGNLQNLRSAVSVFRAEKGRWPKALQEVVDEKYMRAIPKEAISDPDSVAVSSSIDGKGGWAYVKDGAIYEVYVNLNGNDAEGNPYKEY